MYKYLYVIFLLSTVSLWSYTSKEACADPSRWFSARHLEGNGIGFDQGHTTLEGFVSFENDLQSSFFPFLDLRGHLFNDGQLASNLGVGVRYLDRRIWGVNAYYDFRTTSKKNFNQISLGFESLGETLDFRLNGYLPVGAKTSAYYDSKFYQFKEHRLILSSKQTCVLKGVDAEVGGFINHLSRVPLYFAAGPYYLNGKGKSSWGAKGRIAIDLHKYIRLEGKFSYDSIFHTVAQGEIGLIIPLGRRVKPHKTHKCSLYPARKITSRVERNEIIPVEKKRFHSLAINPQTGEPYFFYFVNNLSSSLGTFESPFSTLAAAENASNPYDIIYVYPGDGTSTGMNAGIVLQNNQKIFGAGLDHSLRTTRGIITIPPHAVGMPLLTHSFGDIITAANHNEISGLSLRSNDNKGVYCENVTNVLIHRNSIYGFSAAFPSLTGLVYLNGVSGLIQIINNTLILDNNTLGGPIFGIHFIRLNEGAQCIIDRNTFDSVEGSSAAGIEFGNRFANPVAGNFRLISITNNLFNDIGNATAGKAIGGAGFTGTGEIVIDGNQFIRAGASTFGSSETVYIRVRDSGRIVATVTNNTWTDSVIPTKSCFEILNITADGSCCVTLSGNRSDHSPVAYELNNTAGGTMIVNVGENVGVVSETNTTPGICSFP